MVRNAMSNTMKNRFQTKNEPTWCNDCSVKMCEFRLMKDDAICIWDKDKFGKDRIYPKGKD